MMRLVTTGTEITGYASTALLPMRKKGAHVVVRVLQKERCTIENIEKSERGRDFAHNAGKIEPCRVLCAHHAESIIVPILQKGD